MLRTLAVAVLGLFVFGATAATSEAGARGRSFKVEATDGTDAGIAFDGAFILPGMVVHTPDGDFNGNYVEIGGGFLIPSPVIGFASDNGYVGIFLATVVDRTPLRPGTATINGTLIGTTGVFGFRGLARN
jgi:hypothetical protein